MLNDFPKHANISFESDPAPSGAGTRDADVPKEPGGGGDLPSTGELGDAIENLFSQQEAASHQTNEPSESADRDSGGTQGEPLDQEDQKDQTPTGGEPKGDAGDENLIADLFPDGEQTVEDASVQDEADVQTIKVNVWDSEAQGQIEAELTPEEVQGLHFDATNWRALETFYQNNPEKAAERLIQHLNEVTGQEFSLQPQQAVNLPENVMEKYWEARATEIRDEEEQKAIDDNGDPDDYSVKREINRAVEQRLKQEKEELKLAPQQPVEIEQEIQNRQRQYQEHIEQVQKQTAKEFRAFLSEKKIPVESPEYKDVRDAIWALSLNSATNAVGKNAANRSDRDFFEDGFNALNRLISAAKSAAVSRSRSKPPNIETQVQGNGAHLTPAQRRLQINTPEHQESLEQSVEQLFGGAGMGGLTK